MGRENLRKGRVAVFGVLLTSCVLTVPARAASEADCAARADRAAADSKGAVGGAVVGGAGGAVFGAIVSDKASKGAARGAAVGAIVGGAVGAHKKNETYKRVYDECMKEK